MWRCCRACEGLTVILVALLRALTQSTRSCWSLACRKNFLIPALMTNRRQDGGGNNNNSVCEQHENTDRYDLAHFSRSERKSSGGLLRSDDKARFSRQRHPSNRDGEKQKPAETSYKHNKEPSDVRSSGCSRASVGPERSSGLTRASSTN